MSRIGEAVAQLARWLRRHLFIEASDAVWTLHDRLPGFLRGERTRAGRWWWRQWQRLDLGGEWTDDNWRSRW